MWWFALIYLINSLAPTEMLYGVLAMSIGFMNITIIDLLLFIGPLLVLLPGWRAERWPVQSLHPALMYGFPLLLIATLYGAAVGLLKLQPETVRWYFQPLRNMAIVPVAVFMGYQCLANPSQIRRVVWIVFFGSLGSALLSLYYAGTTTARITSGDSYGFDELRQSALQVAGDAGSIAVCTVIFCWISGVRFVPFFVSIAAFCLGALGMFFIPHRSAWLLYGATCMYAGFYVWPSQIAKKLLLSTLSIGLIILLAVVAIGFLQAQTGRDFGAWVQTRLESILPSSEDDSSAKAWDTRIPGMVWDLRIWSRYPLGGGFAVHENFILETGELTGSFRHTPWTSTLAETGPLGVAGFLIVIIGGAVVGLRLARNASDRWMKLLGLIVSSSFAAAFLVGFMSLSWNAPRGALNLGLMAGLVFRCRDLELTSAAVAHREAADWDTLTGS